MSAPGAQAALDIRGLDLTERYAREVALPALERALGTGVMARLAVGSVGDGSERFGFDDGVSRDHDWGVSLCIWVPDGDRALRDAAARAFAGLPADYLGWPVLCVSGVCPQFRAGVFGVGEHYERFTGCPSGPRNPAEWDRVPEHALAAAVNGRVFLDGPGAFTAVRKHILGGYPDDIRAKRIAERCLEFAQAGQANLVRAVLRKDPVQAQVCFAQMHAAACRLAHTLVGRYCPYYKWMQASLETCGALGQEIALVLTHLISRDGPILCGDAMLVQAEVDAIAAALLEELCAQGYVACREPSLFLLDHVGHIRSLVRDRSLLARPSPRD